MVEVTLREYLDEIESLAEEGAFDAVISHCQHILKAQPRYLPAYSLMGKTALEMDDLEAAADLFSRVLSMDPEDFVARVGMSIASDKEGSVGQATWHMERAYELAPDNQAIAAELRRLYGRRDGVEPEKIALTQGALARLHSRGNLFNQAINEFRQLLAREPERVDLEVALADTLWRADRRIEAAETSLSLLEKLPYCLKANLILGEIWSSSGREAEGAAHLKRAQSIDPENAVAQELFGERSPLSPRQVHIARMEYVAPPAPAEQEPDWLQSLVRDSAATEATDEAVPDWLQAVATSAAAAEILEDDEGTRESDLLPDWLQDVAATADVETEAFVSTPEIPAAELDESEMPDWLVALTAETEGVAEPLAPDEIQESVQEVPSEEEPDALLEEQPEWLSEMVAPDLTTDTESAVAGEAEATDDALPDWLAAMATDEFEITDEERAEAEISDEEEFDLEPAEVPDWLAAMAGEQAQVTDAEDIEAEAPIEEEMELELDELPDWLTEPTLEDQQIGEGEDLDLAPAEIPDWLAEMAPPETVSTDVTDLDLAPAELPDWLIEEEAAIPESTAEEAPEEVEETPDWLSELVEAAGATMAEETPESEPLVEPDEALPEWLVATDAEEPAPVDIASEMEPVPDIEPDIAPSDETTAGPIVIEEPEKERLVYPEGAGGEVTEAEAELLANLEDMSPEEAFAAWEALLAQSELEEATPEPDTDLSGTARAAGPIIIEEPEKEKLVYPEGAGGEVTEAEAALLADLEDMSPEEAFAAWEAMLAAKEAEEAVSEPEAIEPTAAEMVTPEIVEEEVLVEVPEADLIEEEAVADAEAELLASLEEMSPEEAFAAWEATLAEEEMEEAVSEPEAIEPTAAEMVTPETIEEEVLAEAPEADLIEEEAVADAEAELLASLEDMSPEEAFAAWEATLAEEEMEEAVSEPEAKEPTAAEMITPETIEEEVLATVPEADLEEQETVADTEAELLASLEDMSPEEAFAAWEAMLAAEEMEEEVSEPEAIEPAEPEMIMAEITEEEVLAVAPEVAVAEEEVVAEAELLTDLEDMSPEEAFAAWEAALAEGEEEEQAAEAELLTSLEDMPPEEAAAAWEAVLAEGEEEEETDEEAEMLISLEDMSPEEAAVAWEAVLAEEEEEQAATEAELIASLEDMPPEEAFAAWEAMLAEGEEEAIHEPEVVLSLEELEEEPAPIEWPEEEAISAEEIEFEAPEAAPAESAAQAETLETVAEEPFLDEDSTLAEAEAELLASLEDLSPEEAQAAWEALVAEDELIQEPIEEEISPTEAVAEAEDIWMPLAEDEIEEAIALGEHTAEVEVERPEVEVVPQIEEPAAELDEAWMTLAEDEVEEAVALGEPAAEVGDELPEAEAVPQIEEPAAELDEAWMTLAEDELVEEEMLAPAISEEDEAEAESEAVEFEATIVESIPPEEAAVEVEIEPVAQKAEEEITPISEVSAEIEDLEPAIPAWAFAQAIEPAMPIAQEEPVDTTIGPDTVFLTEEEEAEVRVTQERITAPEPAEAALVEEQPAAEEAPPDDVESVQPPTWVALEEEPEAQIEAAAPKVQEVELEMIEPEDDESRLTYARQLWAKGKKADARDEYENLLRTPLRDEATADLERWAAEAPDEPLLRLLGDAYIKQDRLDEALEAYRRALSSL